MFAIKIMKEAREKTMEEKKVRIHFTSTEDAEFKDVLKRIVLSHKGTKN